MKIILYKQKNYGRFSDSRRKGDVMDINEIAMILIIFKSTIISLALLLKEMRLNALKS